ncbi:MAG: hypothetical protein KGL40_04465 [Rhodocyclaceae bacterium]|nr:hypothetical protein [Rhodocyclaceae bacterium]
MFATEKNSLQCLLISVSIHALVILSVPAYENTGIGKPGSAAVLKAHLNLPRQVRRSGSHIPVQQQRLPDSQTEAPPPPSKPEKQESQGQNEGDNEPPFGLPIPATAPYFKSTELSEKPQVVEDIPPTLNQSLQTQEPGYAILRLHINEEGRVDEAIVEASDLGDKDIQNIRTAFQGMKFKPGKIGQTQVKTEMRIHVTVDAIRKPGVSP